MEDDGGGAANVWTLWGIYSQNRWFRRENVFNMRAKMRGGWFIAGRGRTTPESRPSIHVRSYALIPIGTITLFLRIHRARTDPDSHDAMDQ